MDSFLLLSRAYRLINIYNSTLKKPRTYAGGLVLYPAQSHMIEIIGESEGITLTEIAAEFMITKGAVSQSITFLEHKGLIKKRPSQNGGRATGLFLSDTGRAVFNEHRALHSTMLNEVTALAAQLPPEAFEILSQMADVIENSIRNMQEDKAGQTQGEYFADSSAIHKQKTTEE